MVTGIAVGNHANSYFDKAGTSTQLAPQEVETITCGKLTVNTGPVTVTAGGLTVTAGGLTVTAGGLTVTAGGLTVTAGTATLGGGVATDTIAEKTAAAGVTIDGLLIKDGVAQGLLNVAAAPADAAITVDGKSRYIFITKAGAAALTLADPTATTHDGMQLTFIATVAAANTVSNAAGSGFFSSGGAAKDTATFSGAIGDGFTCIAYQGKWYIDPRGMTGITLG